jgi:methanogenic corrinoid protein MtbC1
MRQQLLRDDSFSEAEAMRLVRSLGLPTRAQQHHLADTDGTRHAAIASTVEHEVIPRLVRACLHASAALPDDRAGPGDIEPEQVAGLTDVVLRGSQPDAAAFVARVQKAGVAPESLFLNLLAPTARCLGVMWAEDDCNFADVTIGMLRLANVMRVVGHAFEAEAAPVASGPRAVLAQAPGEQHGFGIAMVACFFRRAGWTVVSEPLADRAALLSLVRQDWFSLVGLSLACSDRLDGLAADIRAIRAASRNPAIAIMVGGFAFAEHPQLAGMVGADGTASDARLAVGQANALVSRLARQA